MRASELIAAGPRPNGARVQGIGFRVSGFGTATGEAGEIFAAREETNGLRGGMQLRLALPLFMLACLPAFAGTPNALTFEIADKVNWRGDKAAAVPASVTETYAYDAASDTVTVTAKFDKAGFAPVPPMLAIAMKHGLPVSFDKPPVDTGQVSVFGPLLGFENADAYTWKLKGLGKYVFPRFALGNGKPPDALLQALEAEVAKVLDAGPLAPWLVLANVPGSDPNGRGEVYWHHPGETLYLLAEAAPLLSGATQEKLKGYLQQWRERYPPEKVRSVPLAKDAPREYCRPDPKVLQDWEQKVLVADLKGPPPVWNLYGLARYYELTGGKPDEATLAACTDVIAQGLQSRDWATLYWQRGHTPNFNAVHGANQLFAGLVGYIRLARSAGDTQAEALGWGCLARAAALRFAMGKYTQFMQANGFFSTGYLGLEDAPADPARKGYTVAVQRETDARKAALPADPAWWTKQHAGSWIGELVTWNWSQPIHNVRQVHRLDETGVDVWEWCGVDNRGTGQKRDSDQKKEYWYMRLAPYYLPFRDMTPELGGFLADHLKPESEAFCERVVENQPHWHTAYSEAILSAEIGFMTPCNAYSVFTARAWIAREPAANLLRCCDVPWLKTGDLFYIHKLAETVKAYRGN